MVAGNAASSGPGSESCVTVASAGEVASSSSAAANRGSTLAMSPTIKADHAVNTHRTGLRPIVSSGSLVSQPSKLESCRFFRT